MSKDPGGDALILDEAEHLSVAAAAGAAEDVDGEGPGEESGPVQTPAAAFVGAGHRRVRSPNDALGGARRARDQCEDVLTPRGVGGEQAVVADLVPVRGGDEGDEAGDEGKGLEVEVGRAVSPPALQRPSDATVRQEREAVLGDSRAEDVAGQGLEARALMPGDASGGVE
jgi:hypothetical protein